jgi:hypothetical protein
MVVTSDMKYTNSGNILRGSNGFANYGGYY